MRGVKLINQSKVLGLLGLSAKAGKITFGSQMCEEQIMKNKVKLIILADDASDRTKSKFKSLCSEKNIRIVSVGTIEQISKAIGKENKAIIGVKDINLKNAILKIIDGGEIIGENKNS